LWRYTALMSAALGVAVFTRTLAQSLLAAALAISVSGVVISIYIWALDPPSPHAESFVVAVPVLLFLAALVGAGVLYYTRRRRVAIAALTAALGLILVLHRSWNWDLVAAFLPRSSAAIVGHQRDWPATQVALDANRLWWQTSRGARVARVSARVTGLGAGLSLVQLGYDVRTDNSGVYARNDLGKIDGGGLVGAEPLGIPNQWQAALQCPSDLARRQATVGLSGIVEVFRHYAYDARPLPRALDGRLHFAVVRPHVVQSVPVRGDEAVLQIHGARVVARRVPEARVSTGLVVRTELLSTVPFPTVTIPADVAARVGFYDPPSGDCLYPVSEGRWRGGPNLPISVHEQRVKEWRRVGLQSVPETGPVPASLQMALIDSEVLGTLDVPFTLTVAGDAEGRAQ
jgi:hypothetical protein